MAQTSIRRQPELDGLVELVRGAGGGLGGLVYLQGRRGAGKSDLLSELREAVATEADLAEAELYAVSCYDGNADNPLGPFLEIMRALVAADERRPKARARKALQIFGEVAPALAELIPVLGKATSVGLKAVSTVGVYALGGGETEQRNLAADIAAGLVEVARERAPLVLTVDEAHWIDAASCEVVRRLAQAIGKASLVVVLAYDPDLAPDTGPLARTKAETGILPAVRTIALEGVSTDAVRAVVAERYGDELDPQFAVWLLETTEGNPLSLELYLEHLERCGAIRPENGRYVVDGKIFGEPGEWSLTGSLAEASAPPSLLDLLRPRVASLDDAERKLLEAGALQGPSFLSAVLVSVLEAPENEVLDGMHRIAEQRRIVTFDQNEGWWSDRSARCAFAPGPVRDLFYERYERSPYERRRGHATVADALEALIAADADPPRQALLEIARQNELAGRYRLAAARLLTAARSTYEEAADLETAALSERALELLRKAEPAEQEPRLLAGTITLFLVASSARWRADGGPDGASILALAEEATQAAQEVDDPALLTEALYAEGQAQVTFDNLERGVETLRRARELARGRDAVAEFSILLSLGHHQASLDLSTGRDTLRKAYDLMLSGALDERLTPRHRKLARARLESRLGVAEFDLGEFSNARRLLTPCIETLRGERDPFEAAWALCFLGQLDTAVGAFDAAEAGLRAGLDLLAAEEGDLAVRGYLKSLLGRVHLERTPPRPEEAEPLIAEGRAEVAASGARTVLPLVETHEAERLHALGDPDSLQRADTLLAEVVADSRETGWVRSEITAISLRARVLLKLGNVEESVALAADAARQLDELGGHVPTVRSEEVYHAYHLALEAAGSPEAGTWLERAAAIVRRKAERIEDAAERESFLAVRPSREILSSERPVI